MSDDKNKKGYQDKSKINTKEKYEMDYWKKELNVSSQQITGAVKAIGSNSVKKIKEYLKDKK